MYLAQMIKIVMEERNISTLSKSNSDIFTEAYTRWKNRPPSTPMAAVLRGISDINHSIINELGLFDRVDTNLFVISSSIQKVNYKRSLKQIKDQLHYYGKKLINPKTEVFSISFVSLSNTDTEKLVKTIAFREYINFAVLIKSLPFTYEYFGKDFIKTPSITPHDSLIFMRDYSAEHIERIKLLTKNKQIHIIEKRRIQK